VTASDDFIISAVNTKHELRLVSYVGLVRIIVPSEDTEIILQRGEYGTISINDAIELDVYKNPVYKSESGAVEVIRCGGYLNVFLKMHGVWVFWNGLYCVHITV